MNTIIQTHSLPNGTELQIVRGDLTQEQVDAIVNAANSQLQHGGGVAGAIVRRGGWEIQRESTNWVRQHGPVTHDSPAWTGAGSLPCRYVIHAVGPRWGEGDEDAKLAAAVRGSLRVADDLGLESLAMPALSTGIFGFPAERAAKIILEAIRSYFDEHPQSSLRQVRLTLISDKMVRIFLDALNEITP
jgi:O-acetyl-ADP-ribose deacetylase (regulator of RNase III)